MSRKNHFGRVLCDIFGVGNDDSVDELGGETESSDFFPVREEASDLIQPSPPPSPVSPVPEEERPPLRSRFPWNPQRPAEICLMRWTPPAPLDDYNVEQALPVQNHEGTFIPAGTMFRGTLTTQGDVEIAGDFEGEIVAKGKVILHSDITSKITALGLTMTECHLEGDVDISGDVSMDGQSSIFGNVRAENMVCSGKVKGDLDIQDNLILDGSAEVDGSIRADTMSVARGARITGSIVMHNVTK